MRYASLLFSFNLITYPKYRKLIILSTKLFVGIGLISYSLYLWHFPIFAFAKTVEFSNYSIFKILLLIFITIILSIFSFFFFERPARNKKIKFQIIIYLILISIFALLIANINIIQKEGYKNRLPEILSKNLSERPWTLLKDSDDIACHNNVFLCKFNKSSNKKIFIIGDSLMGTLTYNLKDNFVSNDYQFIPLTLGGCLYFPGFDLIFTKSQKIEKDCNNNYFNKLKKNLLNEKNSIFIFGGSFPLYIDNEKFNNPEIHIPPTLWKSTYKSLGEYKSIQDSFKKEILTLAKYNKIILIYPIPEIGFNVPQKLLASVPKNIYKTKKFFVPENFITISYDVYKKRTKSSFELLDSIQDENIYRVYPHKLFCDITIKNRCITHDDKNIFYVDDAHPSIKGAEMINDLIMKEIEKIELSNK